MSLQLIKAKLLAVSLFAVSACGTMALFGCVPVIARILSADQPSTPSQVQAFPQQSIGFRPDESARSTVH